MPVHPFQIFILLASVKVRLLPYALDHIIIEIVLINRAEMISVL